MNPAELLRRAQSGDSDAKELLAKQNIKYLRAVIFRAGFYGDDADEIAQETFLRTLEKLETLLDFRTYMTGVARKVIANFLRLKYKLPLSGENPIDTFLDQQIFPVDEWLIMKEREQQLMAAIGSLPEQQQQAVRARLIDGLSFDEIAKLLGIEAATAKSHYYKGLKKLRKAMG